MSGPPESDPSNNPLLRRIWAYVLRFHRFFGRLGIATLAALIVLAAIIVLMWQRTDWQSFLSAAIGGLGATLAGGAALLEEREAKARWILILAGGAFSAWFAYYTTSDLSEQLKTKSERVEFLRADLLAYLKPLPRDQIQPILAEAGKRLRVRFNQVIARKPPFRSTDFDASQDLIDLISAFDDNNGHVHYFRGEIKRALGDVAKGESEFYAYLTAENGRTRTGALGAPPCVNPDGFCRERTAWIFHMLANDFYEDGMALKRDGQPDAQARLSTALQHACSAIKLFPPNGFNSPKQRIATQTLERLLLQQLGKDGQPCPRPEKL
jgi:hypothetical protein